VPNLLQKLSEREKCVSNIVIYDLPESAQLFPATRISDDINTIYEAIQPFSMFLPSNPKLFSIGRINAHSDKPQPQKKYSLLKNKLSNLLAI